MASFIVSPRPAAELAPRLPLQAVPFSCLLSSDAVLEHMTSFMPTTAVLALSATCPAFLAPFRRQVRAVTVVHDLMKSPTDPKHAASTLASLLRSTSPGLRSVSYQGRTDVLILALEAVVLPHVESLALRHNGLMAPGAALLINLLRERCLPALKALDLRDNMLGDTGAAAVAAGLREGCGLEGLEELRLDGNQIDGNGAKALSEVLNDSGVAKGLRVLTLSSNGIGEDGVSEGLGAAFRTGCCGLTTLDLSDNPLGTEGAEALARSLRTRGLPSLLELRLSNCEMGPGGAQHLGMALQLGGCPSLERLHLNDCYVGTGGAQALAASLQAGTYPRLQVVDLSGNGIKSVAMPGLIAALSARCPAMRELRLGNNPQLLDDEAAAKELANALRGGWGLPALEVLDLTATGLNSAGLRHLMAALLTPGTGPCLTELQLSDNALNTEDLKALAALLQSKATCCPRLTRLGVRGAAGTASETTKAELLGKMREGLSVDIA